MSSNTRQLAVDGLSIEVEHAPSHRTVHGPRSPRIYVRVRSIDGESAPDNSSRICLTLTPATAEGFGLLLQQAALRAQLVRLGGAA